MIPKLALIVLLLSTASATKDAQITTPIISISLEPVFASHYRSWVKEAGSCHNIRNFQSPYASRGTIEAVLLCQALKKGGYPGTLKVVTAPNYERALWMAMDGIVTMPGESAWEVDIDKSKFIYTDPVIRNGEFEKGIFVPPEKISEYKINSLNDLQKLSIVSSELWRVDWATIKNMQISLLNEPTKESMFRAVDDNLADSVMLEFSSLKDLSHTVLGIKLVPIPGIKIILDGNRRFVIPKATPSANQIHSTLSNGMAILRKNGTIDRAWRESGFINTRVQSWKILNPNH